MKRWLQAGFSYWSSQMLSLKPQLKTGKKEVPLFWKFLFMMTPFPETQQWLLLLPLFEAIFHISRKAMINLYSELCTLGAPSPLLDCPEQERSWYTELCPLGATKMAEGWCTWIRRGWEGPAHPQDGRLPGLLLLSAATGGQGRRKRELDSFKRCTAKGNGHSREPGKFH